MLKAEIEAVKNMARLIAREEIDKVLLELKELTKKAAPVSVAGNAVKKTEGKEGKINAEL